MRRRRRTLGAPLFPAGEAQHLPDRRPRRRRLRVRRSRGQLFRLAPRMRHGSHWRSEVESALVRLCFSASTEIRFLSSCFFGLCGSPFPNSEMGGWLILGKTQAGGCPSRYARWTKNGPGVSGSKTVQGFPSWSDGKSPTLRIIQKTFLTQRSESPRRR